MLGLGHTNPNTAAIFQPLSPAVVVVLAFVFGVERLTWRKVLGFAIGVGAAVCVAPSPHTHTHTCQAGGCGVPAARERTFAASANPKIVCVGVTPRPPPSYRRYMLWPSISKAGLGSGDAIGMALLVVGVVGAGSYLVLMKQSYDKLNPLAMTAFQYCVGLSCMAVTFIPCVAWGHEAMILRPGIDKQITWIAVTYAVLIDSALVYPLIVWSNKYLEASTVGLYSLLQIISTAVLSYVMIKVAMTEREAIGAVLVCVSLLVVSWQQRIDERNEAAARAHARASPAQQPLLASA